MNTNARCSQMGRTALILALVAAGCTVHSYESPPPERAEAPPPSEPEPVTVVETEPEPAPVAEPEPAPVAEPAPSSQPRVIVVEAGSGPWRRLDASVAQGQPTKLRHGAANAVWIWQGQGGWWHVRTTARNPGEIFRGRIAVVGGRVTDARATRLEWRDRFEIQGNGRVMHFGFRTGGQDDGIDFRTTGERCLRFRILLEGDDIERVVVGRSNYLLDTPRFEICQ